MNREYYCKFALDVVSHISGHCFDYRLLLWDCDDRTYSYYIEVSNDQKTWAKVVDKSTEACVSWQLIRFKPMPVTFIKIVGTRNTANEVRVFNH